jgi:hypothetical protein
MMPEVFMFENIPIQHIFTAVMCAVNLAVVGGTIINGYWNWRE